MQKSHLESEWMKFYIQASAAPAVRINLEIHVYCNITCKHDAISPEYQNNGSVQDSIHWLSAAEYKALTLKE